MEKNNILNLEDIHSEYSFYFEELEVDKYFCSCGGKFESSNEEEVSGLESVLAGHGEEMADIYKDIKLALDKKIQCPHCEKNFSDPDNKMKLIPAGKCFISGFEFKETEEDLFIYYAKSKPEVVESEIQITEDVKYIRFEKETKNLFFRDFGESATEIEFDLDESIHYVDLFLALDTNKILNIFKLHMYINRVANFVSDTNNSTIVDEFLMFVRSRPNEAGIDYIKKLLSIFFGIIKYTNLSTVALTKGSQFLYDLMIECEIPSSEEMIESKATSPVKIFNYLVTKYINKLNQEVNEEDKESHDFAFKSKQRIEYENETNKLETGLDYEIKEDDTEASYLVRSNKDYKGGKVVKADGKYQVMDAVEDGTISKFIYNHITNFAQYKQIIKYFKFYDKKGVIAMLQKYDLELLTKAIDIIYFRDKMEPGELDRVLQIIDTFVKTRFFFEDYDNIKEFSFVEYDDARMMMEILEFNPNRHFNKIKTYDDLVEYHDVLVNYYNAKNEEERTGAIKNFVDKFRFLEAKGEGDYEGPLEIELHDSPGRIIKEGTDMRHSAAQYARNVAKGDYLLGSVYDRDPNKPEKEIDRFTIGFKYNNRDGLEFDQVKGFANQLGSNRFKNLMMEFLTEKDVSFRPIKDLKLKAEKSQDEEL
jgi:hypothetical protein